METLKEKYERLRPELTDGCLGLISKPTIISKTIKWVDKAEFSHVLLVFEKSGRFFCIDSNTNGVHPELLSKRIDITDNFCFIKPLCPGEVIQTALSVSFFRAEGGISYDFTNGFKESLNRKFNTSFKIKQRDGHNICSKWVRYQAVYQEMVNIEFAMLDEPFPQDYLRYRNTSNTKLLI